MKKNTLILCLVMAGLCFYPVVPHYADSTTDSEKVGQTSVTSKISFKEVKEETAPPVEKPVAKPSKPNIPQLGEEKQNVAWMGLSILVVALLLFVRKKRKVADYEN